MALYSEHMFNQSRGSVDSNLTLCEPRLSWRREVCAAECEASVCLDVTRGSVRDLHFSISGENSGT